MYNYSKIMAETGGFVHKNQKIWWFWGGNLHLGIYKMIKKS